MTRSLRSLLSITTYVGKLLFACSLHYSGILYLYGSWKLRNRAIVLMYHRVLPKDLISQSFSNRGILVEVDTFKRQIEFISKHFSPVAAEQLSQFTRDGLALPNKACVITFDDGWQDNYDHAFPALRAFGVPATIFLPISYVGQPHPFWQEHLASLLYGAWQARPSSEDLLRRLGLREALGSRSPSEAREHIENFVAACKMKSYDEIHELIREVSDFLALRAATPPVNPDRFMSWAQIAQMDGGLVTFGSHAVSHRILPRLAADEQRSELEESRKVLERRLDRPIRLLAYPNGDHDDQVRRLTREAGYVLAFTTEPGLVEPGSDPFRVRRVNIHEGMTRYIPMFHCRMLGIL